MEILIPYVRSIEKKSQKAGHWPWITDARTRMNISWLFITESWGDAWKHLTAAVRSYIFPNKKRTSTELNVVRYFWQLKNRYNFYIFRLYGNIPDSEDLEIILKSGNTDHQRTAKNTTGVLYQGGFGDLPSPVKWPVHDHKITHLCRGQLI